MRTIPNPVTPNDYVYSYLKRISGPQSALGTDYDMNTDSDLTPTVFAYSNSDHVVNIARINIEMLDGSIRYDRFAGVSSVLSNGCLFRVVDDNGGARLDFLGGVPIVRNADFAALAGVDAISDVVAGDDLMPIRFSLFKASDGRPLRLCKNFRLEWVNQDDLSTIVIFRIMMQGILEKG